MTIWTCDNPMSLGGPPANAAHAVLDWATYFHGTNQVANRLDYFQAISRGDFSQADVIAYAWWARYGCMYGGLVASLTDMTAKCFEATVLQSDLGDLSSCLVETPTPFGIMFVAIEPVQQRAMTARVSFGQLPITGEAVRKYRKFLIETGYQIANTVDLPDGSDAVFFPSDSDPT